MIKNNIINNVNLCDSLKYLNYPSTEIIIKNDRNGNNISFKTQIKILLIIIECFLLNQVFTFLGSDEDTILKNNILTGKCQLIKNTIEAEHENIIINIKTLTNYMYVSSDINIDKNFEPFENIISTDILKLLSLLKDLISEKVVYPIPEIVKIPEDSVQYKMGLSSYLFSKNNIIKLILDPLHQLAKKTINIKKIKNINSKPKSELSRLTSLLRGYNVNSEETVDFWDFNNKIPLIRLLNPIIQNFTENRIKPFAEIIIPKIKNIYKSNPTIKTAHLLAKIGIPALPFLEILEPPPNIDLEQTIEEKLILEPLETLINDIEIIFDNLNETFFNSFLMDIIKRTDLSLKLINIFNIEIEYGKKIFNMTIRSTTKIKDLRIEINELIAKTQKIKSNSSVITLIFALDSELLSLLTKNNGVLVEMEDQHTIANYNFYEGSKIIVVPKIKTGFIN